MQRDGFVGESQAPSLKLVDQDFPDRFGRYCFQLLGLDKAAGLGCRIENSQETSSELLQPYPFG